jgi:hypothetical protein
MLSRGLPGALRRRGARSFRPGRERLGWSYTVNHTDRLASEALVRVHMALTAEGDMVARARA